MQALTYKNDRKHPSKSTTWSDLPMSILSEPTKVVARSSSISAAFLVAKVSASSPPENMFGPASMPPWIKYLVKKFKRRLSSLRFAKKR